MPKSRCSRSKIAHHDAPVVVARHWADGGAGAEDLARTVVDVIERVPGDFRFVYDDADTLWDKVGKVATTIYGASEITADSKVRAQIRKLQDEGYGHYPVCIAKTQYSFSTDPRCAARRRATSSTSAKCGWRPARNSS